MSEMIERVARALWSKAKDEPTRRSVGFSFENDPLRLWWIDQARAAIEAMREPTKMMLNSTADVVVYYDDFALNDGTCYMSEDSAEQAFKSMIDAALKETV